MNNELGHVIRDAELSLGILIERTKAQENRIELLEAENYDLRLKLEEIAYVQRRAKYEAS